MPNPIVLVLAPHTDDGELGCGGTLARHCREGSAVYYAAFSTCERSLPPTCAPGTLSREVIAATARLGIPKDRVILFDYDVRSFPAHRQDILDDLVRLRAELQPTIIYLPSASDVHQDHQIVASEGFRAFKQCTLFGYELPWNNNGFEARAFVTLTTDDMDAKIAALAEYRSQSHRTYMAEDFTRGIARVRGVMAGALFAEAFEILRLYR